MYDPENDDYPLFLYYATHLVIPANTPLRIEYNGLSGAENPGFVAEWWPYRASEVFFSFLFRYLIVSSHL